MSASAPESEVEYDLEHATRPDETVAVNEAPDRGAPDDETTAEMEIPASLQSASERRARERYNYMITRSLLAALSTGAIEAVSGAASLRMRGRRAPVPMGPRSLLSHTGAPQRVVSVTALRPILRRKREG